MDSASRKLIGLTQSANLSNTVWDKSIYVGRFSTQTAVRNQSKTRSYDVCGYAYTEVETITSMCRTRAQRRRKINPGRWKRAPDVVIGAQTRTVCGRRCVSITFFFYRCRPMTFQSNGRIFLIDRALADRAQGGPAKRFVGANVITDGQKRISRIVYYSITRPTAVEYDYDARRTENEKPRN